MKALKTTVAALALLAGAAGQPALANLMFDQGLQDRTAWEQWFNSLQGDHKTGAFYWSGQRSLLQPGSCQQMNADFYRGCTDAKVKLAPPDALRKTEPAYKAGWNSYAANVEPIAAPEMTSTPAPAPQVPPTQPAVVVDKPTVNLSALEQATRACVAKRTQELRAKNQPGVLGDELMMPNNPMMKCGEPLTLALKSQGKSNCQAIVYVAWVSASAQASVFGLASRPFEGDPSFEAGCERAARERAARDRLPEPVFRSGVSRPSGKDPLHPE